MPGSGMCECLALNMPEETCDATCQKTRIKTYVNKEGMMVVDDNKTKTLIDPSKIDGYYGDFVTQSAAGVKEGTAIFVNV